MLQKLHASWLQQPDCRQARKLLPGPDRVRTHVLLSLDRRQLKALVGLWTGHWSLNKHLSTIGVVADATCPLCKVKVETTAHFLCECDALTGLRFFIFGAHYLHAEDILSLRINSLLKYISASGRF